MPSRPLLTSFLPPHRILSSSSKHSVSKSLVILILAVVLAFALVFFFIICFYRRCKQEITSKKPSLEEDDTFRIHKYKYRQLKRATKSFSQNRKLGKGGFGAVYRGLLNDGKEVAVKKLDLLSLQGEREFQNELFICSGLDSPYVVSLLGYCTHGKRVRLLVYECMRNRSLQEALFEKGYPEHLDWGKRFKIIVNTAKALEFLHVGCNPPIIHGDVKPSNILLDQNFSARIADFGLARFKTEHFGSESARYSMSSEKLRPETPERFRFGTPDCIMPGTPELSRSSTTRNPLLECSYKAGEPDFGKEINSFMKVASFTEDTLARERLCKPGDTVMTGEALSYSPDCSHVTEQLGKARFTADEIEGSISPTDDKDIEQKAGAMSALDVQTNVQAVDADLSITQDSITGETKSPPPSSLKQGSENAMWQKGDEIEQLAGKEYVLDWLGSELHANGQALRDSKGNEAVSVDPKSSRVHGRKSRLGGEETRMQGVKKERKKVKPTNKKGREWWKDEYFAELSGKTESDASVGKKRTRNKNVENWKDYLTAELSSVSGELRADPRSTKIGSMSKEWNRDTRSGELSLCGGVERQRVPSIASDMCSEDRKCHFSAELISGQWSGELTKSGELVSKDVSSTTSMRGTVCYVAPEYGGNGILSEKSDIYSFGVLMLVILSGRRPIQVTAAPMKEFERANLISWARTLSQCGKLLDLMDEGLNGEYDREEAVLCITLALLCLQRVPSTRPHISEIVKILSREMAVPNLPLELSPSPPARILYKLPARSPKEHHPLTEIP